MMARRFGCRNDRSILDSCFHTSKVGHFFHPRYTLDVYTLCGWIAVAVIHDPSLVRTTNQSGLVANLTMEELKGFDAAARFLGKAYGPHPIPVLG